jgi:hypothetical protein
MTRTLLTLLLLAGLGCESPPEERCKGVPGESGIDFDCEPSDDDRWQDRRLEEAEEGMEERRPGSRP